MRPTSSSSCSCGPGATPSATCGAAPPQERDPPQRQRCQRRQPSRKKKTKRSRTGTRANSPSTTPAASRTTCSCVTPGSTSPRTGRTRQSRGSCGRRTNRASSAKHPLPLPQLPTPGARRRRQTPGRTPVGSNRAALHSPETQAIRRRHIQRTPPAETTAGTT